MEPINCTYCKKPIVSKDDILLGTHFANTMTPYHVKCFDEAKKNQGFFSRPVMKVPPSRFNFFLGVNIFNIIIGILLLVFSKSLTSFYPQPAVIIAGIFILLIGLMFVIGLLKYKKLK